MKTERKRFDDIKLAVPCVCNGRRETYHAIVEYVRLLHDQDGYLKLDVVAPSDVPHRLTQSCHIDVLPSFSNEI